MELDGDTKQSSTAVRQLSKRLGLPYMPSKQEQLKSNRKQAFEASFIKGPKRKVKNPNKNDKRLKKKRKQHKKFKNGQLQKLIQNVFQDLNEMDVIDLELISDLVKKLLEQQEALEDDYVSSEV